MNPRNSSPGLVLVASLLACGSSPGSSLTERVNALTSSGSSSSSSGTSSFAILSAAPSHGGAVTCTNGTITGDVGSSGVKASVVQTSCPISGAIIAPVSAQVVADFNSAYAALAAIPCDRTLTGTLDGVILKPGVYCFDAAA